MILKFRLLSPEDKGFVRDFEIDSEDSFLDFHNFIQNKLKYNNKQIASFFLSNDNWDKETEITLLDMEEDNSSSLIMADTAIIEHLCTKKQKLLYVFDFFSNRSLKIELIDIIPDEADDLPRVISSKGKAPEIVGDNFDELLNLEI